MSATECEREPPADTQRTHADPHGPALAQLKDDISSSLEGIVAGLKKTGRKEVDVFPMSWLNRLALASAILTNHTSSVPCNSDGRHPDWDGGVMVAIPKEARRPVSKHNVRGILLSSVTGKVFAKHLRTKALRHLRVPHMTIGFASNYVHQRAQHDKLTGVSSAVFFSGRDGRLLPHTSGGRLG